MGSHSYTLRPGETNADFIRRDCPTLDFEMIEEQGNYVFALIREDRDGWASPHYEPCADGSLRVIAVAKMEGGFVKYMDETHGPYCYGARCSADMLARASALKHPESLGGKWATAFRARMTGVEA